MANRETRRPTVYDFEAIKEIAANYDDNPLPDNFEEAAIYTVDKEIKAFGVLRAIEILFYVTGSNRDRVLAIKNLLPVAIYDAKQLKHDNIYIFAENEHFAHILEKHFNFRHITGVPMILDLENDKEK